MKLNRIVSGITLLILVTFLGFLFTDLYWIQGVCLTLFFLSLSFAIRQKQSLKGLSFTVLIFAAVSAAMYFPSFFIEFKGHNLKGLIVPLLMIIMFGMGTSISIKDFIGVVKSPYGVLVGLICQFTVMPFIGYLLVSVFDLPSEIAAGVILVGCSPSGLASNVMSYISKSNLALSLTLTAIATLLAPFITPFLMKILANELVPIDYITMFLSILKIVILPIFLGFTFNHFFNGRVKILDRLLPMVSMAAIVLIIVVITAAGRASLINLGSVLVVVVIVHNVLGYIFGFGLSKLFGLDKKSARTIAFEVGMQNSGLASGIALEMGRIATMGLAPTVFGPVMNISGSALANYWSKK